MRVQRINDKTIHCIITKEDLESNDIGINDLFERKDKAIHFIKAIVQEAAKHENFSFEGEYTSMKISVLPDQSVSLTLTVETGREEKKEVPSPDVYLFHFQTMQEVIRLSQHMPNTEGVRTFLYEDGEEGGYHLVVERDGMIGADYERLVLSMNEFGTLLSSTPARITHLKEHEKCLLREDALGQLSSL